MQGLNRLDVVGRQIFHACERERLTEQRLRSYPVNRLVGFQVPDEILEWPQRSIHAVNEEQGRFCTFGTKRNNRG